MLSNNNSNNNNNNNNKNTKQKPTISTDYKLTFHNPKGMTI